VKAFDAAELSDQGWETSPNERFTSGEPNLRNTLGYKEAGKTLNFVEGKDLRTLYPLVFVERHAVGTPEIAPVGHRDAEATKRTFQGIGDIHFCHYAGLTPHFQRPSFS
jgi:hypothetical protein